MTTTPLGELFARAKKAPKPHHDIDIYLDNDTADRIVALEQQLEELEKDKRFGDPRQQQVKDQIGTVQEEAAASLIVLRFRRLPAEEWADITARAPMRFDAPADRMYGYNVHDAGRAAAAASGVRLVRGEDGAETEEALTDEEWEQLFEPGVLSGRDFSRIVDAIFDLNDYSAQQRLDAARKASRAGTGTTSN